MRSNGWSRGISLALAFVVLFSMEAVGQGMSVNPAPPLGSNPGASRQAWSAAAALSRGIRLQASHETAPVQTMEFLRAERLAAALDRAGFRSALLPVHMEQALPLIEPQLKQADALADLLLARGMSVVLEVHSRLPKNETFTLPALRQRYANDWRYISRRYAGRDQRLLFEVPLPPELPAAWRNVLLTDALKAIRTLHPQRVVVVGWQDAIGLPALSVPDDIHLIMAIRNLEPFRFTHQGVQGLAQSDQWLGADCCTLQEMQLMQMPLDVAKAWSMQHRYPVWLGDFISYKNIPARLRERHARLMRDFAEARGLPWAYGDFSSDFGVYDVTTSTWMPLLLDALLGH